MSSQFVAANQNSDGRSATFAGLGLSIEVRPQATYPHTFFNIRRSDGRTFSEPLYYSHLGLGQMLTQYTFSNVLETVLLRELSSFVARKFLRSISMTISVLDFLATISTTSPQS